MPRDGNEIGESATTSLRKRPPGESTTVRHPASSANIGGGDASGLDRSSFPAPPVTGTAGPGEQHEIGTAETPVRQRMATAPLTPKHSAPSSEPIEAKVTKPRRKRARSGTTPAVDAPASESIGPISNGETGGDGHSAIGTQAAHAIPAQTEADIVRRIVECQSVRRHCIKTKNKLASSLDALIASTMGYRIDADMKERKALFARATTYRVSIERGGEGLKSPDGPECRALAALRPTIMLNAITSGPYDDLRKTIEKEMGQLAKRLYIASFAETVSGFGMLGLAVVQAEAGIPISEYRTVSGLWKRLGLAVIDGRRQRKVTDKEQAIIHGYSPKRRAEIYTFLSDTMFKHQWAGARLQCLDCGTPQKFKADAAGVPNCDKCKNVGESSDVIAAHPTGHYGEVYQRRKLATLERVARTANLDPKDPGRWTLARAENDARRIMSKALLRDLWRVAHGLEPRRLEELEG